MSNDHIDINMLANLARIDMSDEEKEALRHDIESILAYVKQVQEIETPRSEDNVGSIYNVMRDDTNAHEAGAFTEDIMNEAPAIEQNDEGVYLKVKKIL